LINKITVRKHTKKKKKEKKSKEESLSVVDLPACTAAEAKGKRHLKLESNLKLLAG
jgi:hypothetical protein